MTIDDRLKGIPVEKGREVYRVLNEHAYSDPNTTVSKKSFDGVFKLYIDGMHGDPNALNEREFRAFVDAYNSNDIEFHNKFAVVLPKRVMLAKNEELLTEIHKINEENDEYVISLNHEKNQNKELEEEKRRNWIYSAVGGLAVAALAYFGGQCTAYKDAATKAPDKPAIVSTVSTIDDKCETYTPLTVERNYICLPEEPVKCAEYGPEMPNNDAAKQSAPPCEPQKPAATKPATQKKTPSHPPSTKKQTPVAQPTVPNPTNPIEPQIPEKPENCADGTGISIVGRSYCSNTN